MDQAAKRQVPANGLGLIAIALFVTMSLVVALFTVTAVAVTPQKHLEQLLPANTVAVVSASQPNGRAQGTAISLVRTVIAGSGLGPFEGNCLNATAGAAGGLPAIGDGVTLALLPDSYRTFERLRRNRSRQNLVRVLLRSSVLLVPLDIQLTLPMLMAGHTALGGGQSVAYDGVRIHRIGLTACRTSPILPSIYYAASFEGYVLIAARLAPIESVIDTGTGRKQALHVGPRFGHAFRSQPAASSGLIFLRTRLARERFPGLVGLVGRLTAMRLRGARVGVVRLTSRNEELVTVNY